MSETIISTADDGPQEAPDFAFEDGEILDVWQYATLPSGHEHFVIQYEIDSRTREYVVEEDEWYIDYKVTIVYEHRDFTEEYTLTLSEADILEDDAVVTRGIDK